MARWPAIALVAAWGVVTAASLLAWGTGGGRGAGLATLCAAGATICAALVVMRDGHERFGNAPVAALALAPILAAWAFEAWGYLLLLALPALLLALDEERRDPSWPATWGPRVAVILAAYLALAPALEVIAIAPPSPDVARGMNGVTLAQGQNAPFGAGTLRRAAATSTDPAGDGVVTIVLPAATPVDVEIDRAFSPASYLVPAVFVFVSSSTETTREQHGEWQAVTLTTQESTLVLILPSTTVTERVFLLSPTHERTRFSLLFPFFTRWQHYGGFVFEGEGDHREALAQLDDNVTVNGRALRVPDSAYAAVEEPLIRSTPHPIALAILAAAVVAVAMRRREASGPPASRPPRSA